MRGVINRIWLYAMVLVAISGCYAADEAKLTKVSSAEIEYDFDKKIFNMNGKPFTGISVIKDSAGNTVKEIAIVNGKQNGYDIQYKDGKPISKFLYKNGVKEGISLIYSLRDYTLYQEVSYKNDKKDGALKEYNPEGKLVLECVYKDDKRDGYYKAFTDEGRKRIIGQYIEGKKSGKWIYYKNDGTIRREKDY